MTQLQKIHIISTAYEILLKDHPEFQEENSTGDYLLSGLNELLIEVSPKYKKVRELYLDWLSYLETKSIDKWINFFDWIHKQHGQLHDNGIELLKREYKFENMEELKEFLLKLYRQ